MTNKKQAVVVGVFRDRELAERAVADLKEAGWQSDQITIVGHGAPGVLTTLKQALTPDTTQQAPSMADLESIALPEEQRQFYQRALEDGSLLLLVDPQERPLEAREILHEYGAYHVFLPVHVGGERTIPVRREKMQVQKEMVEVGELRIHKRVITEHRTLTIPITREEVTIERLPYQMPAPPAGTHVVRSERSFAAFEGGEQANVAPWQSGTPETDEVLKEGGTLRIVVREEQVLISKQAVVVEEILLHKETVQDMQHIVEPVKHEEVSIEQIGRVPLHESRHDEPTENTPPSSSDHPSAS